MNNDKELLENFNKLSNEKKKIIIELVCNLAKEQTNRNAQK